jgi:uncharacterized protein
LTLDPDLHPPPQPLDPRTINRLVLTLAGGSFLLVFLLFLAGQLILVLNVPFGLILTSLCVFGAAGLFFPAAFNQDPATFTGLRSAPIRLIVLGIVISAANVPLADFLMAAAHELLPHSWSDLADDTTEMMAQATHATRVLLIIGAGVAAPLGEELFFRGWLQNLLAWRYRWIVSAFVVAIVFSATHLDPVGFVARVELGMLFGLARGWTGSLWPGIAMHATHNVLSMATFYLLSDDPLVDANAPLDWKSAGLAALGSAIIVSFLLIAFRRSAPAEPPVGGPHASFRATAAPTVRILAVTAITLVISVSLLAAFRRSLPGAQMSAPQPTLAPDTPKRLNPK